MIWITTAICRNEKEKRTDMKEISEEKMAYLLEKAAFCPSKEEIAQDKEAVEQLLTCFEILNELDTAGAEPREYQKLPPAFREDAIREFKNPGAITANAPSLRDGAFAVPGTIAG